MMKKKALEEKAKKERIAGGIELLPGLGKLLAWIYKHWGLTGLISFLSGLALSLGLIYFGVVPAYLVSDKYKSGPQTIVSRSKPSALDVSLIDVTKSELILRYMDWLEANGEQKKKNDPAIHVGVGAVQSSAFPSPTEKFTWSLRANPGFDLNGRVFVHTSSGAFKLLEPLKENGSLSFNIPELEKGDNLIAVISATWSGVLPKVEIQNTFSSLVK